MHRVLGAAERLANAGARIPVFRPGYENFSNLKVVLVRSADNAFPSLGKSNEICTCRGNSSKLVWIWHILTFSDSESLWNRPADKLVIAIRTTRLEIKPTYYSESPAKGFFIVFRLFLRGPPGTRF